MASPDAGYLSDPAAITRQSFAAVAEATDVSTVPEDLRPLALRLVHASAEPDLISRLCWSPDAGAKGHAALVSGAAILTDSRMVADGITRARLPAANAVMCTLTLGSVAGLAARAGTTRSAAAVTLWPPWLDGAAVAIGNAPTALFRLLEGLADGWPRPALILGFPVGFIGAAESKAALCGADVPFVTVTGRAGGSALAAAAVNALAAPTP